MIPISEDNNIDSEDDRLKAMEARDRIVAYMRANKNSVRGMSAHTISDALGIPLLTVRAIIHQLDSLD